MESIGFCGGGLVALILFLVAVMGSAALAGAIALALAKLGVTVDARLKGAGRDRLNHGARREPMTPYDPTQED